MTEQAKVPAIRFAGFTDPWEQRKLENLASFGGGHTPSMLMPVIMLMEKSCGLLRKM